MKDAEYEVLVVGGGPAGSACAIILAMAGVRVALLEKERFPREKICGDTLNPRTWPLLERLGVSDELRAEPLADITRLRVFNPQGQETSLALPAHPAYPFVAVRRSVLDTILLRHAGDLGTDVFESTIVEDISLNGHIAVQTRCGGSRNQFNCTLLVGADGRNSLVATKANPERSKASTYQHDGRIGLQWYTSNQPGLKSDLRLYLLPFGYFGIVHVDEKTTNLAMVLDTRRSGPIRKELPALIEAMRTANPTVHRDLGDLTPTSEVQTTSPITPWSRRHSRSNVHLIGDAGRTVEPFTGEGILFALLDGIGTGEEIVARLRGRRVDAVDHPSRFWVNRVFSPLLRHPRLANAAVALGAAYPPLTRLASRVVIPA